MEIILKENQKIDDESLIKGLLDHIPGALKDLDRRYHHILKSIIIQVLHNETEADDVLQEVLLQVWERASTYSSEKGKFISWLCTLARRRAIDRVRQFSAYHRATDRYEDFCNDENKNIGASSPVTSQVERDDLRALLQRHLHSLPPAQECVIRMAYFENRSQCEIAGLTNTPLGTVKTRLELGIKKMASSIGGLRKEMF